MLNIVNLGMLDGKYRRHLTEYCTRGSTRVQSCVLEESELGKQCPRPRGEEEGAEGSI